MPDYKRQHYVPRCYLKPFTLDDAGAAINLYNIPRSRAVQNAPAKGQCAKNYLYGHDLELERVLQLFEGEYARIIRVLQEATKQPTMQDLAALRDFAYLQYARTDMAIKRMRIMQEGMMHNVIFEGRPVTPSDLDLSDRAMMLTSLQLYVDIREYIEDLKNCVIKNETRFDFVTSDDPSIFTSRFHIQKLGVNSFGMVSSGALFFMPLTPRLLLMCYDGSVYTIPNKKSCYTSITSKGDVSALNELQYLKAAENIYFSRWDDRDRVEREFHEVSPRRPQSWCNFSVWVPDGSTEEGDRYRRATEKETRTAPERMVAMSGLHAAPSGWISKLKYRHPLRTYFDGSAAGHVRKAKWLKRDR